MPREIGLSFQSNNIKQGHISIASRNYCVLEDAWKQATFRTNGHIQSHLHPTPHDLSLPLSSLLFLAFLPTIVYESAPPPSLSPIILSTLPSTISIDVPLSPSIAEYSFFPLPAYFLP